MCVFQDGLKEGVVEKSEERLKWCMDGLMLFLRLSHEGKVCCSCYLPVNSFHCLFGDLPAVGGKCQIMKMYPLEIMFYLAGLWPSLLPSSCWSCTPSLSALGLGSPVGTCVVQRSVPQSGWC